MITIAAKYNLLTRFPSLPLRRLILLPRMFRSAYCNSHLLQVTIRLPSISAHKHILWTETASVHNWDQNRSRWQQASMGCLRPHPTHWMASVLIPKCTQSSDLLLSSWHRQHISAEATHWTTGVFCLKNLVAEWFKWRVSCGDDSTNSLWSATRGGLPM